MERAPGFRLQNAKGEWRTLDDLLKRGPVLLVFYPGDFTPVCTKQLCAYRDERPELASYGVTVVGISGDSPEKHAQFIEKYGFNFELLADPGKTTFKDYGIKSNWLLGALLGPMGRGNVIISRSGEILYRKVESTPITYNKVSELVLALRELRATGKLA